MTTNVAKEVAILRKLTAGELRIQYAEVFGETTSSGHRAWLIKRIAWRRQVNAEGDISERARRRAADLADDSALRLHEPRVTAKESSNIAAPIRDERIPPVGSVITRTYKGDAIEVTVLSRGFLHAGQEYATLSAVAKAVTGTHCNGMAFFKLGAGR